MKNKALFTDLLPDPDQHAHETEKTPLLSVRTKATFQWPPDCLWPFIDQDCGWDSDT
jgi:hypothetical protein